MKLWSRAGYLTATAVLSVAGGLAAGAFGAGSPGAVAGGLAVAWVLQAPAFWRLAGKLARGQPVVREWVGGIALRLGGLGVIVTAGATTRLPARDAAVAYVVALLAYLALEAVWLFRRQPARPGSEPADAEDDDTRNQNTERAPEAGSISHRSR